MTTAAQRLVSVTPVPATETKVITVGAGIAYYVSLIVVTNIHASTDYWLKLWEVPNSGGAEGSTADGNLLIPGSLIPFASVEVFHFGAPGLKLPEENDTIWVQAESADQLNLRVYGFTQ